MTAILSRLMLRSFRNYSSLDLSFDNPFVVFCGANGSGKTNILEAISLFTPGKGMRRADFKEMNEQGSTVPWAVSALINGNVLGTGIADIDSGKRLWFLNNEPMRGRKTLNDLSRLFWLTPETDRLFSDSPAKRRQFVDRMIFATLPEHAVTARAYEHAVKERLNLLVSGGDEAWIEKVEAHVAEHGLKIAATRAKFLASLPVDDTFSISMEGAAQNIDSIDEYLATLRKYRARDAACGMTLFGAHRSDTRVVYLPKNQLAERCSTGEQKMLLAKIAIAFLKHLRGNITVPLSLLFDDVISHLDFDNRVLLFERLLELRSGKDESNLIQVFFTGTEREAFAAIEPRADFFMVDNGSLRKSS